MYEPLLTRGRKQNKTKQTVALQQMKQDLINRRSYLVYFKIRVFNIYQHIYVSKMDVSRFGVKLKVFILGSYYSAQLIYCGTNV